MHAFFLTLARASLIALVATGSVALHAQGGEVPVWNDEPPVILRWLDEGYAAEFRGDRALAARRYCDAAREGSLEGQYRLGRLLLRGSAPDEHAQATTLLALATRRGHEKARVLLANQMPGDQLPACLHKMDAPPPAPQDTVVPAEEVERYVAALVPWRRRQARLLERLAPRFAVDPRLAIAIARVESNFDALAVSSRNAQGLMQLLPETAERYGVRDVWNAEQNARGGLAHLRWLLQRFEGDVALVSAAYNAGEGAVERHGGIPPFTETRAYVKRVLAFYRATHHVAPEAPGSTQARPRP